MDYLGLYHFVQHAPEEAAPKPDPKRPSPSPTCWHGIRSTQKAAWKSPGAGAGCWPPPATWCSRATVATCRWAAFRPIAPTPASRCGRYDTPNAVHHRPGQLQHRRRAVHPGGHRCRWRLDHRRRRRCCASARWAGWLPSSWTAPPPARRSGAGGAGRAGEGNLPRCGRGTGQAALGGVLRALPWI